MGSIKNKEGRAKKKGKKKKKNQRKKATKYKQTQACLLAIALGFQTLENGLLARVSPVFALVCLAGTSTTSRLKITHSVNQRCCFCLCNISET